MSPLASENHPVLARTPEQGSSSSPFKRKRQRERFERRKRPAIVPRQQPVADRDAVAAAEVQCQIFSGNDHLSCYPNSSTTIYQNEWSSFVWNSRLPQYAQNDLVNVYLFRYESNQQFLQWSNLSNPINQAGVVTALINDSWWGGTPWNGKNTSFLFYWVVTPGEQPLGNSYTPQSVFTVVQTTYANSVLATLSPSSTSSPSSLSSGASPTITSVPESKSTGSPQSSPSTTSGSVQADGSSPFPHWAIAVIVVLGFLAILASCVLAFIILRRLRRRREADQSHRGSVGSSTPMMAESNANAPSSPLLGAAAAGAAAGEPTSSTDHHDAASVISRANSAGDSALFSGADAAIMADAFRKALRKPDFAGGAVEEESPEEKLRKETELLNRELAEEGRDIRSVSSSRGVRVETLSDNGETVRDKAH